MTTAAAQASDFYDEFLAEGCVFGVRDAGGCPAPRNGQGQRAMPFWSQQSRAERIIATVPAYAGMQTVEISSQEWLDDWLPDLEEHGIHIGLNWSGTRAVGYDVSVADLRRNLEARRQATAQG